MISAVVFSLLSVPPGTVLFQGEAVSPDAMVETLREYDTVFIGEKHDDPLAHEWELYIWNSLAGGNRKLALEMFETDVQPLLDSYLNSEVTEEEFLEGSRPWGNYASDYSPLVELARERGLGVVAANVPRRFAAMVASGGWEAVAEESFFQELAVDSSSVFYRERFMETMDAVSGEMHGMPMDRNNIYRAQLLKDAVMAFSIRGIRCVFVCGSFHSDFHSGVPDQMPTDASLVTVKILPEGEEYSAEAADYVIVR